MRISEIFVKPVDRAIDPVVKAGSMEQLANELEEYVVTPELRVHLNNFLDEYNEHNTTGNGAWIFGFFGSGKSHLLKMLAVLLEDRDVDGERASEYFLSKVADDKMLDNSIRAAISRHPSESLLFNIDSKAPSREVPGTASLLVAFIKVFFEHCGYYAEDAIHIGAIERDLDNKGLLGNFKEGVASKTGKDWDVVRKAASLYAQDITEVFDKVNGQVVGTTANIIAYYQQSFTPSIEDFAGWVADYIKGRTKGFRLNFFVDEIGQYIAKNDKHMINLQTIAEELNSKCDGQSWVIVTSQENVEDIIGEMTKKSANDFSRIQARFKVKMPLTSKDAQAIIKQRLLRKQDAAKVSLGVLYDKYNADFGVLFDFTDGAKKYKPYQDLEDFVETYPFVPYQFDLFTASLRGLSEHNALTGSHHSVGARSMLGVFQEMAKKLAQTGDTERGELAAFDAAFDGLRTSIKPEEYAAIQQAEGQLTGELYVRVLKALFMVKYCDDFKGTVRNLRVLLYGGFSQNANQLERGIQEATDELERQVYIRRSGNLYEYLTSDEKDVENEIKNIAITSVDVKSEIGRLFTEGVVPLSKLPWSQGQFSTSFAYDVRVDGEDFKQQRNELKVNVLTALSTEGLSGQQLFMDVIGSNAKELTVVLQNDKGFIDEVRSFIKTAKYVRLNSGGSDSNRDRIIKVKSDANKSREQQLVIRLSELVTNARFSAAGVDITEKVSGSGADAVKSAGKLLIARAYPKLQQLKSNFSESSITSTALDMPIQDSVLPEYASEVLARIAGFEQKGYAVMVGGESEGSLIAYFSRSQYGWPDTAVRMAVAELYAYKQIEVERADRPMNSTDFANALAKSKDLGQLRLKRMTEISNEEMQALNIAYRTATSTNPAVNDAKAIAENLRERLVGLYSDFVVPDNYLAEFPFKDQYKENISMLAAAVRHDGWEWYARDFPPQAQAIRDAIDDLKKAKRFIDGSLSAGKLWREIKVFLANESADLDVVDPSRERIEEIKAIIKDPNCYKNSRIPDANAIKEELHQAIVAALDAQREAERDSLKAFKASAAAQYGYAGQPQEARDAFNALFAEAEDRLSQATRIASVRGFADAFKQDNLQAIEKVFAQKDATEQPPRRTRSWRDVAVSHYSKATIEDVAQADEFVEGYRKALYDALDEGFVILP